MSNTGEPRIALVHDELTRRGGAEVVFEEMAALFPEADIYTLYAGRPVLRVNGRLKTVATTFLQSWPAWFRRHPSRILPLLPHAAEQIDLSGYDLVISSSSGFAKAIVTRAAVPHVCYCHTPTRYLWDNAHEAIGAKSQWRWLKAGVLHYLRLTDYAAAQRVDVFIANSRWTAERINTYYRRPSRVIYPPVDTAFYTPAPASEPRGYFLCAGRLTESKHFEQAIQACEKLKLKLVIAGRGRKRREWGHLAGPQTTFAGRVDNVTLRRLYRGARALLQPGEEDFGMAAVEALACGTPVIALGRGGALETVRHGETGWLYRQPTVEALAEAIRQFLLRENRWRPEAAQRQAMQFSRQRFAAAMRQVVQETMNAKVPHF